MFRFIQVITYCAFASALNVPKATFFGDKLPDFNPDLANMHLSSASNETTEPVPATTKVPSLEELFKILQDKQKSNSNRLVSTAMDTQRLINDVRSKVKTYEDDFKFLPLIDEDSRKELLEGNIATVGQILKMEVDNAEKLAEAYQSLHDGYRNLSKGIRKDSCVLEHLHVFPSDGHCLFTTKVNLFSQEAIIGHQSYFENREKQTCYMCRKEFERVEVPGKDCIRAYKYITRENCQIQYEINSPVHQNSCRNLWVSDGKSIKIITEQLAYGKTHGSILTFYCQGDHQRINGNPRVKVWAKKVVQTVC